MRRTSMRTRTLTALLLVFSLLASGIAAAQTPQPAQEKFDEDAINKIKEEGMKHSQVMDTLSYITDVSGARLTGSPNLRTAQEWAKSKLSAWGLQNARLEA